jgi:type I restriction enzyme, S subunit
MVCVLKDGYRGSGNAGEFEEGEDGMREWKETTLSEIAEIIMGQSPRGESCNQIGNGKPLLNGPTEFGVRNPIAVQFTDEPTKVSQNGDILFCVRGSTTGRMNWADQEYVIGRGLAAIRHRHGKDYQYFIKGLIDFNLPILLASATGSTFPNVSRDQLENLDIFLPTLPEQRAIASVLSSLDDKIDLLHRQNKTLEAMAETLFRQWFVEEAEEGWESTQLREVVDISIGRTPPRHEFHWFSENPDDVKWISIKDLGASGVFVFDTAEYLTQAAVDNFNIPVIPENTVLLSFKMTVGRVGITTETMLSNEAIAHFVFRPNTPFIKEYLYIFLKIFKYDSLGSTSSIVTAINSTMIKDMEILIPDNIRMARFKELTVPLFNKIKQNQMQIRRLSKLRDTLLPKLMNGKVRLAI